MLALPLDSYAELPQAELELAAAEAGLSVDKFLALVQKAKQGTEVQAAKKDEEAQMVRKLALVPGHARDIVRKMDASIDQLNLADALETEAYSLLEKGAPGHDVYKKFLESQIIYTRDQLFKLCQKHTWQSVFEVLKEEKKAEAHRGGNVSELREAMMESVRIVENETRAHVYVSGREHMNVTGPAEVYDVNTPMNYRRNPRPRRYNDELDHD